MPDVLSPLTGVVVSVNVAVGDAVHKGQTVAVIESMKMEHVVEAEADGTVESIAAKAGDQMSPGDVLLSIAEQSSAIELPGRPSAGGFATSTGKAGSSSGVRPDLAEVVARHEVGLDENRPDAVARRRKTGQRTARENVYDLIDEGSLVEYGPIVVAAQRRRRSMEELIAQTPADGMIGGIAKVDGRSTVVVSYDYTVLAGTQGAQNHRKKDRLFELAAELRAPLVFFTEGGGGRPGDTDGLGGSGLDVLAFRLFGELSGLIPLVGINSGRCFAGNAAILGCCDVVIATAISNIGLGCPALVVGGGLGVFMPEEIGPMSIQ
ncbi:MAG: hypothetical protein QOI61_842, partial [Actinomycetota bacterium]